MKKFLRLCLTLLLIMSMLLCAACGGGTATLEVESEYDNDFFTDEETDVDVDVDVDADEDTDDTNSSAKSKSSSKSSSKSTNKTTSIDTESVKKATTVGGKSWSDVLASMPKSLKGTKLTVVNWNPISEYTGASAVVKEFQKQTGITVNWTVVEYGVYTTKIATMVASGNSPDVIRTRTPNPSWMQSLQSINCTGYDFSDEAWDQVLMKDYTVNGVCYATSLKNTHIGSVTLVMYNKDLISKYNYEDPYKLWKNGKWTMSKYLSMCREFKKDSGEDFASVGDYYETWSQLYGIAGPVGFDGSKFYSNLSNSKFLTVTQQIADWYKSEQIMGWGRAEYFDEGKALFYVGGSIYLRRNNSYFGSIKSSGTLYAVPMPSVDGQSTYYQPKDEYEAYGIPVGAKNAQAVPYFLRYYLDGANYDLDSFYCNKQNLEVYTWCMSQENTIWTTKYESSDDTFADGKTGLYSLQSSQIKSYLDSNSYMIDERVKKLNNLVSKLNK